MSSPLSVAVTGAKEVEIEMGFKGIENRKPMVYTYHQEVEFY